MFGFQQDGRHISLRWWDVFRSIVGGPIDAPQGIGRLASQIDLARTVLGLLRVDFGEPLIGRNLLNPAVNNCAGRAILQFDKNQLFMVQTGVQSARALLLRPQAVPTHLHDKRGEHLKPAAADAALEERAMAHALWAKTADMRQHHKQDSRQ